MIQDNGRLYLPFPPEPMGAWRDQAACRGAPSDWFFPSRGEDCKEAKALCAECPVVQECLDWAVRTPEKFGVWGGKGEKARMKDRRLWKAS